MDLSISIFSYVEIGNSIDMENFVLLLFVQESRLQAITEQSSIKFTEVFRTKYGTFMKKSQSSSVFSPEEFLNFDRTFFCIFFYYYISIHDS